MIKRILNHSYFSKTLASFLIILLLPISIMVTVFYESFLKMMDNEVSQSSSSLLAQLTDTMDIRFYELNQLGAQIQTDPFIAMIKAAESDFDVVTAVKHLSSLSTSNSFINTYYIYFNDINALISSTGMFEKKNFFSSLNLPAVENEKDFRNLLMTAEKPILFGPMQMSSFLVSAGGQFYVYIVPLPFNDPDKDKALICFISESSVSRIMAGALNNLDGGIFVYDSGNNLLTSYSKGTITSDNEMQHNLLHYVTGPKEVTIGKKTYIITSSVSRLTGWSFVSVIPKDIITYKVNAIRNNAFLYFVLTLVVGIITIYYLSRSNYKPIKELMEIVSKYSGRKPNKSNEIQSAKSALDHMGQTILTLNEKIQTSASSIKHDLLSDFLKGRYRTLDDFNEIARDIGVYLKGKIISVAVLYSPDLKTADSALLLEHMEGFFDSRASVYATDIPLENHIALIFSTFPNNIGKINDLVSQLQKSIGAQFHVEMSVGLGCWYSNISEAGISYLQAVTAVDYRFVKGKNTIIPFEEIQPQEAASVYYHDKHLKALTYSIIQGNFESIDSTIDSLMHEIKSTNMPLFVSKSLCYNIINLVGDILAKLSKEYKLDLNSYPDIFTLSEFETMEELAEYLKSICAKICTHHVNAAPAEEKSQISALIDYIHENYTSPSFSLYQMADFFQLSLSNLSQYFKTHTNENITEYVRRLRIEKAMELLQLDDGSNLQVIAGKVGYENVASFIRNFRQHTNVTPGVYRENLKSN